MQYVHNSIQNIHVGLLRSGWVWLTCKHPGEDKKQTSSGFDTGKKPDHLQCRQRTTIASGWYHYNTDFDAFQRARRSGGAAQKEETKNFSKTLDTSPKLW
jgi:hypothetical protein